MSLRRSSAQPAALSDEEDCKRLRKLVHDRPPGRHTPAAQLNLGATYREGRCVKQDSTEAVAWYRKAAERGLADAQFSLGAMYAKGQGVPQDFAEA